MIIGDPEDPPAGGAYADPKDRPTMDPPGFSTEEEDTKVATPAPQRPAEARKETKPVTLEDIFGAIVQLRDDVATLNDRVGGIDAGLGTAWDELAAQRGDMQRSLEKVAEDMSAIRSDMNVGFEAVMGKTGAHATALERVAKDVGLMREQHESFGAAVSAMPPRLAAIEDRGAEALRLSCAAFDVAIHNEIPDDELQACETIVAAARRAAR